MKHIRSHNLENHDLFCDLVLTPSDVELIHECARLIDDPQKRVSITLTSNRPATLSLMPDTAFPIVRAV